MAPKCLATKGPPTTMSVARSSSKAWLVTWLGTVMYYVEFRLRRGAFIASLQYEPRITSNVLAR